MILYWPIFLFVVVASLRLRWWETGSDSLTFTMILDNCSVESDQLKRETIPV